MIPINAQTKMARPADINAGNLVAFKWEQHFALALVVLGPAANQNGLLRLKAGNAPTFALSNNYCLDFGKPVLQWAFDDGFVSDATEHVPSLGHLVVHPEGVLITGVGVRQDMRQANCAWHIETGVMTDPDLTTVIYLRKWALGITGADGKFQELFSFAPSP